MKRFPTSGVAAAAFPCSAGGAGEGGAQRDRQTVSALLLLNLAGGEGLDDLDPEADDGLGRLVRAAEAYGQSRRERRVAARR